MKLVTVLCFIYVLFTQAATADEKINAKNNQVKPLRIVALAPHIVEMLFEIGVGDQIVGTVEYADYPEKAKSIPRIGGYYGMQIEKVLALNPDVIFAWESGNKATDLEQLKRLHGL